MKGYWSLWGAAGSKLSGLRVYFLDFARVALHTVFVFLRPDLKQPWADFLYSVPSVDMFISSCMFFGMFFMSWSCTRLPESARPITRTSKGPEFTELLISRRVGLNLCGTRRFVGNEGSEKDTVHLRDKGLNNSF